MDASLARAARQEMKLKCLQQTAILARQEQDVLQGGGIRACLLPFARDRDFFSHAMIRRK
jgi:hypothetical protein